MDDELSSFLPTDAAQHQGGSVIVTGARGKIEAEPTCSGSGELCLSAVSLASWQGVVPPRIRDAVDEEPKGDIERQLQKLAERYRRAYDTWMECVTDFRDELGLDSPDD